MTNAGNAGPNAVQTVNLASGGLSHYSYDNNGNRISGDGKTISYNAFNKPVTISTATSVMSFSYGADGMRYKQVKSSAAGVETTHYVDKLAEVVISAGVVSYRSYIDDIAIVTRDEVSGQALDDHRIRYTHRDRLGSVISLTDHNNLLMEHRSYDPFGKPRHGSMQDPLLARLSSIAGGTPFTTRGFTDHEHLDDAELIHMNGRVYDYNLGRFLSVDPFIQAPGNSQSMNPYSYIMNNPLAGTDPSGYVAECNDDGSLCELGDIKVKDVEDFLEKDGKLIITTKDGNSYQVDQVSIQNGAERQVGTIVIHQNNATAQIGSQSKNAQASVYDGTGEPDDIRHYVTTRIDLEPNTDKLSLVEGDLTITIKVYNSKNSGFTDEYVDDELTSISSAYSGKVDGKGKLKLTLIRVNSPDDADLRIDICGYECRSDLGRQRLPENTRAFVIGAGRGNHIYRTHNFISGVKTLQHEVGHYFGLYHQPNESNSSMSYSDEREVQPSDRERLYDAYKSLF